MASPARKFVLDPFGLRQFNNPDYTGTQVNYDPELFEKVQQTRRTNQDNTMNITL
jgi:hypothetical protein